MHPFDGSVPQPPPLLPAGDGPATAAVWPTDGPRDRARRDGLRVLSDGDLVALVLGHGTRGQPVTAQAASVLEQVGGLAGLTRAGPAMLARIPGLGRAKAYRLAAGAEIGRRIQLRAAQSPEPYGTQVSR